MPAPSYLYIGDLMIKMLSGRTGEISRVQYAAQKTSCFTDVPPEETQLPRASCESQGVSSSLACDLIEAFCADEESHMHRLMIVRNGTVICDCPFAPYEPSLTHATYSLCKSITGMAIGFLLQEGKLTLDARLGEFFTPQRSGLGLLLGNSKYPTLDITVRDLLTMQSGASFSESGAVSGNKWTQRFLESGLTFAPGTQFAYNSMNSYMLSAIVTRITEQSMSEYLLPRLFQPLGIARYKWEQSPEDIDKGGWGMFLRAEDMAKLGIFYLQKGVWNGKQLLSADYVEAAVSPQADTGKEHAQRYGYHLWCTDVRPGAYTFNGMFGQDVFVYPDLNMLIVTNAGNNDIFQENRMATTIGERMRTADALVRNGPLKEDYDAQFRLGMLLRKVSGQRPVSPAINGGWSRRLIPVRMGRAKKKLSVSSFSGRKALVPKKRTLPYAYLAGAVYEVSPENAGLMPLFMQVVHNNFTDGITKVSFDLSEEGVLVLFLHEGDAVHEIPVTEGADSALLALDFHGEIYAVKNRAQRKTDADGTCVLENRIAFLEDACVRNLRIHLPVEVPDEAPQTLTITMDETPGSDLLIRTIRLMTTDAPSHGRILSALESTGITDTLADRMSALIKPELQLNRI